MNIYLMGSIIVCCVLLSICMVTLLILSIGLLFKLNKIAKNISKLTSILNFETKILAPLMLGKKLLCAWLKKRNKHLPQDIEDILDDENDNQRNWLDKICTGAKWTAAALAVWCVFRRRD